MLLERIYDQDLAQASYMIGCQAKGEAIVVDARRDIAPYLELAAANSRAAATPACDVVAQLERVVWSRRGADHQAATAEQVPIARHLPRFNAEPHFRPRHHHDDGRRDDRGPR